MKVVRRVLTVLACAFMLVGIAVSPASAHDTDFVSPIPNGFLRNIDCPHPYLVSGLGPVSLCTTEHLFGPAEVGYYSPLTNEFSTLHSGLQVVETALVTRKVVAADGIKGAFHGGAPLNTVFGKASFGVQYVYYGFQPIGRWGSYNYITGNFHPSSDWAYAEHPF